MKQNRTFIKGALFGALAMLLIFSLVSCGLLVRKDILKKENERKLSNIQYLIDEYYMGDINEDELVDGIYQGYVLGLGDPYSVYYDEEATESLLETLEGEYSGIGAVLSQNMETGIITMLQIYEDSPAMKAGLKDGDILYKVDGKEVSGTELSEVVTWIKGEKGTEVELTIMRAEEPEEITVTAVRDEIQIQTVSYEMLENNIGYIEVTEFGDLTYEQYKEAMDELEEMGMTSLIVDLRDNPGGSLDTVCQMSDLMLGEGLIVYTEDKNGEKTEYTSDEEQKFEKPLIVLVNGNSASASEIFAGAIQDHATGKIVGTQTYGKGVVQSIFDLKDGTCLKLTVSEYFTPNGRNIHGEGITPDVVVEYETDTTDQQGDNQLKRAIEELKK